MTQPKLSIVTPSYNDGDYIERYVDSIFDQDYPNIQLIIVDDCSTDKSAKKLKKLEEKYKDKEFKVIYLDKNRGACYARNHGATFADGKYISFLPADSKLYPGMARIWVESLEKYPEYDFLYGGYKFTDENYNEVFNFLADEFDPYFLEVTNYIDGSFPLKMELYKKMGGWDESVKSLQDWDFWLNAVKNHGAKGLYIRDVFFETVQPHAGGLSYDSHQNWLARTDYIKQKYGITNKDICVTGTGARFHARNMAKVLEADYKDFPAHKKHRYQMIYLIGFFGNVMEAFFHHAGLRVVHWIGSDILALKNTPEKQRQFMVNWIKNNVDINLTEFEQTRKELEELGIFSRILPLPPRKFYEVTPLPEKFTVAIYDPAVNKTLYNSDLMHEIAKEMDDIEFKFYGDYQSIGKKNNIEHCGSVSDMDTLIKNSSCLLRITTHDGLPISFLEFMSAGRHVVTNVAFDHTIPVEKIDKEEIKKAILKAKERAEDTERALNVFGSDYVRTEFTHEKYKKAIYGLLEYDAKKYWDTRAECWHKLEGTVHDAKEEYIIEREIQDLKVDSVIDIGCGDGRLSKLLAKGRDYLGVDISEKLIGYAKESNPDLSYKVADMRTLASTIDTTYDLAFTFTGLLHLKPEELDQAFAHIKQVAQRIMIIEPTKELDVSGVTQRTLHPEIVKEYEKGNVIYGIKSSFAHDYTKYIDVEKMMDLGGRTLIIGTIL